MGGEDRREGRSREERRGKGKEGRECCSQLPRFTSLHLEQP